MLPIGLRALFVGLALFSSVDGTARAFAAQTPLGEVGEQIFVPPAPVLIPPVTPTTAASTVIRGYAPGAQTVEVATPLMTFSVPVFRGRFAADVALRANSYNDLFFRAIANTGTTSPKTSASRIAMGVRHPMALLRAWKLELMVAARRTANAFAQVSVAIERSRAR